MVRKINRIDAKSILIQMTTWSMIDNQHHYQQTPLNFTNLQAVNISQEQKCFLLLLQPNVVSFH